MTQPLFDQTDLNDVFLRAFKDCATGIINSLSTDAKDPAIANAVQTIVAQLNYDYSRFAYVIDVIQSRVYRDTAWVDAAIAAYNTLAMSIDPVLIHPVLQIRGPLLVQHQLMKVLQAQFTEMMAAGTWSHGFILFLGQLGATRDSIGSLTPGVALHILAGMIDSQNLFGEQNLDLLLGFVMTVGPFLDAQALSVVDGFGERLRRLQDRIKDKGSVINLAFYGLLKLRESGWGVNATDDS